MEYRIFDGTNEPIDINADFYKIKNNFLKFIDEDEEVALFNMNNICGFCEVR